jgi:conjugal transfer mating pair stabilization protein TraG
MGKRVEIMATYPISVYGDGALFREYFNAIAAFFGTSNFSSLVNLSIALAFFTVMYSLIMKRNLMDVAKWMGVFYISVYMLYTPKVSVVITDRVNGNMKYIVDNIPFGLAVVASYTSTIGDALTQSTESNFTMPDYMPYHQTGMVFASRLVSAASQFEITDATFDANLQEFSHQCIFYDILLNKYSINELMSAPNVWNFVTTNASPARAFIYNGSIVTCKDGATQLTKDWGSVIDSAMQQYGQRIYPSFTKDKAKTQMLADLPTSYRYLTQLSDTARDIMQQNLMANAIQRDIVGMGAKLNASAALESYAFTRAQEQKRLTNQTMGDMAAYWLPLVKITLEAVMYGSFIFVVLLSVFPFGGMVLRNYVYSLLWIQLWAPLYAIINLMVSYHAQSNCIAAADGALSLKAMSGILQINSDIAGLAGYLTMLVPMITTGLVFGLHRTLSQVAHHVGGVAQSVSSAAVGEAVTGNMSFGNTSLGNHNAFNTSANHVDTSGRVSSGMVTMQLAGGSSLSVAADGSHIMDMRSSLSNLATSVNFADALRSSYSQQAERAYSTATSEANAYGQATNAAIRDMYDISHHLNQSNSSGDSWSVSASGSTGQAISENDRLTRDFADRHHLSYNDSASVLANAYVDGKLSAGVGAKFSAGSPIGGPSAGVEGSLSGTGGTSRTAGHSSSTDKGSVYSEAQSFIHDTNYAQNVDLVSRSVRDHSFRTNNEEGNRLVNSMGSSFDKAESARHDMQSSYQEAESARQNASFAEEHAASIQVSGAQRFSEWIANQPGTNGQGRMGPHSVEAIQKDPVLAQHYANQFLDQYKQEIAGNWNRGLPSTKQSIQGQFHSNSHHTQGSSAVQAFGDSQKTHIQQQSNQQGLMSSRFVDTSAKEQTDHALINNHKQVSGEGENITQQGNKQQTKVQGEESRERHGGLWHDFAHDIDTKKHS